MKIVSYTDLRQNLAHYLDQTVDSRDEIVVTRQGGKEPVVLMALSEFEGWKETAHLLGSPANAARLLASVRDIEDGRTEAHEMIPPAAGKP